ncbi:MAG TPA: cupin domain-containing protein [Kofleriaceae bacterium]|nr:cupin domain-containing protein [Kofleriaceae bacterium]
MAEKNPAVHVSTIETTRKVGYPEPFRSRMGDREKRRLGDRFGITQFGVNLVVLAPGGQSALRHWHSHEDELVYILSGELVLVTDAGEQVVGAGMVVGFPAGSQDAHHLINRSDAPAQYLEIGTRSEEDNAYYPDDDMKWHEVEPGRWVAAHKDGTPYE